MMIPLDALLSAQHPRRIRPERRRSDGFAVRETGAWCGAELAPALQVLSRTLDLSQEGKQVVVQILGDIRMLVDDIHRFTRVAVQIIEFVSPFVPAVDIEKIGGSHGGGGPHLSVLHVSQTADDTVTDGSDISPKKG